MAEFVAFDPDIRVNGETVLAVVNGMGSYHSMALEILADNGLGNIQASAWYPQQAWLDAFRVIAQEIGALTLFAIGRAIPESAHFPPEINSLEGGLAAIDVAYHMNHAKAGEPMFNPSTGAMLEGIGHYRLACFDAAGCQATMVCYTPYPCDFDRGIVTAMARRFKPMATVTLDPTAVNKPQGGDSSTYLIGW